MDQFSVSFSLLDISGVVLAIIGFFNLSGPLERAFKYVRAVARATKREELLKLRKHWPPHRHIGFYAKEALWSALHIILTAYLIYWFIGDDYPWLQSLLDRPAWMHILIIGATLPPLMILFFFYGFIWSAILIVVGTVLWRLFYIMSKAPAGVVGTIGLVVTFGSLILG